jgi:Uma2 family endonuclease
MRIDDLPADSLAHLLRRLGDVPPHRVRLRPPPGRAKERHVLEARAQPERWLCELVEGTLVDIAYDFRASVLGGALASELLGFARDSDLGVALGGGMMVRLGRGLVRIPSVSFYRWEQFPGGVLPDEEVGSVVPSLIAEVFRRGNTLAELARKRREYFAAGVRRMWVIYPATRTAQVFRSPNRGKALTAKDSLDGQDVLPGFSLSLGELFGCLGRDRATFNSEGEPR